MNLTAYSDSESEGEVPSAPRPAARPAPKAPFQKVVDRAHPGRITVTLPGASQHHVPKDDLEAEAPPAKKPRLGGGSGLGGFNAMLPAPKKHTATPATSTTAGNKGHGKALAPGVNLKTGAEPAFKRELRVNADDCDEAGRPVKKEPLKREDFRAMLNLPASKTERALETTPDAPVETSTPALPQVHKPVASRFVPMSVGKGKKKKPPLPHVASASPARSHASSTAISTAQSLPTETKPARKPKVSLFGVSQDALAPAKEASHAHYQPLLYGAEDDDDATVPDDVFDAQSAPQSARVAPTPSAPAPNDLTNIASELNLSEAERRQLFGKQGRSGPDFSSARIVEFNTDAEYAHNELLRQQGEQVQHNALKSISGTGKNSLKSLVSAATTQKDALEDHFAASHRNKKEAGNRYGW